MRGVTNEGLERAVDLEPLVERARGLCTDGLRHVLGITGPPGAGKTTLVHELRRRLSAPPAGTRSRTRTAQGEHASSAGDAWVAHVPMDGFHLADVQLDRLGLRDRKGAPETFDVAGYLAMLRRFTTDEQDVLYAPGFERDLEQPIAAALEVAPSVRLLLTEGNYLLLDREPWRRVRELLDEVWYVDLADDVRLRRLVARHVEFGKSPEQAAAWVARSDEANSRLVAATRARADLLITR